MSAIPKPVAGRAGLPEPTDLHSGDRMTQAEFHRVYSRMPEHFKAELIGGVVYVASPLRRRHGVNHPPLTTVLYTYKSLTQGVEVGDNATLLLGEESEPQPDLYLRVLPECGGQSRTTADDYIEGAPELVAEIALSSRSLDLHDKRADYAKHGVREYLVLALDEHRLYWFDLRANEELFAGEDGVLRIRTFPGLWINGPALLRDEYAPLMATLQQGLASPGHAAFVAKLAAARRPA